jgi:TonB family protein
MQCLRVSDGPASVPRPDVPDVFSPDEIALAAGVSRSSVERALEEHRVERLPGGYLRWDAAVAAGRLLCGCKPGLFSPQVDDSREPALPATVSAAVHAAVAVLAVLATSAGLGSAASNSLADVRDDVRLVYLVTPGPGGGGGGGGARQKLPPPKAMRQGTMSISSPVPDRKPPDPVEAAPPRPEPPPPQREAEVVQAPVATVAADPQDRPGALGTAPNDTQSRGPGVGGGIGTGAGTGIGDGTGTGIGEGEGGGTGGGPYRPGSGISPPRLLHEVRPDYTDEARRAGLTGEVVLEIVVRRDGSVGDVRVLQGLGLGLDRRAIDAVKQWRFTPAQRLGRVVDVLVEVAVEFRLR